VITFSESSTEELKLNMIFSRATRVGWEFCQILMADSWIKLARQGEIKAALSLMLQIETWFGLTVQQYGEWASEVRSILFLDQRRRCSQTILVHVIC
jgi:hypothetical protein